MPENLERVNKFRLARVTLSSGRKTDEGEEEEKQHLDPTSTQGVGNVRHQDVHC